MNKKIDFQGLMNIIKATELSPIGFDMSTFLKKKMNCGTVGCLIGNFSIVYPTDSLVVLENGQVRFNGCIRNIFSGDLIYTLIAERFGITTQESIWLFGPEERRGYIRRPIPMEDITKESAISRLRKFIYYKLHKNEMTLEEGRYISGNLAAMRTVNEIHNGRELCNV